MFELIKVDSVGSTLELTLEEILTVCSSLNEVCSGIDIFEFQTRLGVEREYVEKLMRKIKNFVKNDSLSA